MVARVGDGIVRNIDPLYRPKCGPGHFEEKSVGAPDLKQALGTGVWDKGHQSSETKTALFFDDETVRHVVAIFVASEIISCIELPQLLFRQGEIGGREFAFFAPQQSGYTGWTQFPTTNQTFPFHRFTDLRGRRCYDRRESRCST